jgi:hypothetical protein
MIKHPPDPVLEEIYLELKRRKLAKNSAHFMREYVPGRSRITYRLCRASPTTLLRLWQSLTERGQHDLAIVAHRALLASAVPQ